MKSIQPLNLTPEEIFGDYGIDYKEPLLEYVAIIAKKYKPQAPEDIENGQYVSRAINTFAHRYISGKVDVNCMEKYKQETEIQQIIQAMGYDVHKFWYLLIFIHDYCNGICVKGVKPSESPKDQVTNLINGIIENIKALNNSTGEVTFFQPAKIVLDIHRKRKIIIDNPVAFPWLAIALHEGLKELEEGCRMEMNMIHLNTPNGHLVCDPEPNSIHIWYFANMFLSFFDLKPPIRTRQKKGENINFNKKFLVSRFIYLTRLTANKKFLDSEDTLKRYLKKHENYQLDVINTFYLF